MTRVTAPINKLTRSLTANPTVARPAYLANASRNAAVVELMSERDDANRRFTMSHRPKPQPVPSPNRTVPLMQTFRTSAAAAARLDASTIDYAVMPIVYETAPKVRSIRVPILPDNYSVSHKPEEADPVGTPAISVVATHPENVTPASPLTGMEDVGVDGVELKFAHGTAATRDDAPSAGMLTDLWTGLLDDVFGPKKTV